MTQTVTCPNCNSLLHSKRAIPAGTSLRCPGCRTAFTAPQPAASQPELSLDVPEAPDVARSSLFGAPFVIAVAVALVLGLSVVTAAVVFALRPAEQHAPLAVRADEQDRRAEDERRVEQEKKKLADAVAQLDEQKRKLEHARILAKAEAAMNKGDIAEAEKLYKQALDVLPNDADTVKGLVSVQSALLAKKKTEDADKKRRDEVETLLADGRAALKGKKYANAVRALESARAIDPTDKAVREALDEALTAVENDKAEKGRLTDFQARLDAGKLAMKAERFPDAVKEFQAAVRLMPDDLDAAALLKQAENKLINLADKEKRQQAFDKLVEQARAAQRATRFNEAIQTADAALRLIANDREAERIARTSRTALKKAKVENAERISQADAAAKLGKIDDARGLLQDALKAWAEDTQAEKALRNLDRLVNNAQNNQVAFQRALTQAQAAMQALDYAAAVAAYQSALRWNPNDPDTVRLLAEAQRFLKREAARQVDYDLFMKRARAALDRAAYADAVTALERALKAAPTPDAVVLVKTELIKARYGKAMADGRLAMQQGRRADAVAAFTEALNQKPGDFAATQLKRQAETLPAMARPRRAKDR